MKLYLCNFSILALGQKNKCFLYWTKNKRSLSGRLLFCFTDMLPFDWLDFTQKFLKKKSKDYKQTYFFLAHLGPYWNATWFLLNSLPFCDWLLYQQGLIMLLCWQQICAFQLLLFWYKLPQFLGDKLESCQQFFTNEVSNSVAFFLWIPPIVSWLWDLLFWKYIDYFALHGGFFNITSFIGMLQALFFQ